MSKLSDILTTKKPLFGTNSFMGKLDLGALRQLHRLSSGEKGRINQMRRYGHSGSGLIGGGVGGLITGGPVGAFRGAMTGGAMGYQNDDPFTGKSALKEAGKGGLAGLAVGKISSGTYNTGAAGAASEGAGNNSLLASLLSNNGGQAQQQQDLTWQMQEPKKLKYNFLTSQYE